MAQGSPDNIAKKLASLQDVLQSTRERIAEMTDSGVEAGEARSIELLQAGLQIALSNLPPIHDATEANDRATALELAIELQNHVQKDIARPQILDDLAGVAAEAEEELRRRVGRHRKPVKKFIENTRALRADIEDITGAAESAARDITAWASKDIPKESDMAHDDDNLKGIENAIQQLGRQLSFATASGSPASTGSTGTGRFRTVTGQMAATLDALGMPHHGVQFATEKTTDMARDALIENLLSEFQESERNGNTVYTLGGSRRRTTTAEEGRLLAGAAKSAARRVRAEADNILDILDRLPDLNRFQIQPGALSPADARKEVAERFLDLDEVMADPYGVNIARAVFALRRVFKGLMDYFDYANLEPEFMVAVCDLPQIELIPETLLPIRDPDELSKRRSPSVSEELTHEIGELAAAFNEVMEDVLSPLLNKLGSAAVRLELYLTSAYNSARNYRDVLVRTGTSLPEQDLLSFKTQVRAVLPASMSDNTTGSGPELELSIDQVMDWIMEVAEPFTGASFRANMRERRSLMILADELKGQSVALASLMDSGQTLGFAVSLYGPIRQLEELKYYVDEAQVQAATLAGQSHAQAV